MNSFVPLIGLIYHNNLPKDSVSPAFVLNSRNSVDSLTLDPALVWSEFQGVIRGSENALQTSNGSLDRDSYETLSDRKQATFARHRPQLYDIFEVYMKQKRERGGFDAADRYGLFGFTTWHLLNLHQNSCFTLGLGKYFALYDVRLHVGSLHPHLLPTILILHSYVDEVQDNLLIDAKRVFNLLFQDSQ